MSSCNVPDGRLPPAYGSARLTCCHPLPGLCRPTLRTLGEEHGTRFEFECYDVGQLYNLAHFLERGLVKPPLFVQTIFGILGGIGPDHDNLVHMKRTADRLFGTDYHWSILAAGRHQMSFVTMGAIMGGHDDARGDSPLLINETPQASDLTESAGV